MELRSLILSFDHCDLKIASSVACSLSSCDGEACATLSV